MKWIKKNLSSIILAVIFLIGLSLLLYPSFSNWWNSIHQTQAVAGYVDAVAEIDTVDYENIWQKAENYNQGLLDKEFRWSLTEEQLDEYNSILNINGSGIMGYIEIPVIDVTLPIYHGVDEAVLQIAVGHIEGSSLPVGGKGTHCVLSGHRGLPSSKLFTNLDKLKPGDLFMMQILDETLTYEVDQIRIVTPDDMSALEIDKDNDLCTLVTCTPYGINTHRLLVRGHRTDNVAVSAGVRVSAEAIQIEPILVAPAVAIPILLALFIWVMIHYRKKK